MSAGCRGAAQCGAERERCRERSPVAPPPRCECRMPPSLLPQNPMGGGGGGAWQLSRAAPPSHLRVDLRLVCQHAGEVVHRHLVAVLEPELGRLGARLLHQRPRVACNGGKGEAVVRVMCE